MSAEARVCEALTLFMPALEGKKPMTRHEPLIGRKGPYANPSTTAGMMAWRALWVADGRRHVEGPVLLEVYVRVKRPKTHLRVGHGLNVEGRKYPVPTGFDLSNVVKLVEDALKLHAFGDDALISAIHAHKSWASGKDAGVEVTIAKAVVGYPAI